MCKTVKQQILAVIDGWIEQCNDDINHTLDSLLEFNAERCLRELYDRKIDLVKFRLAFNAGIQIGSTAYSKNTLAEVVDFICDMDEQEGE